MFVVIGLTLIVGGSIFVYLTLDLPGPASTAAIVSIILGIVVTVLGMFGYSAARERKILGSEFKGKVKLFIYAGVMGAVFVTLMSLGIVLLVWLGDGAVPDTGHSQTNVAAGVVVDKAKDPVHNFVGCVYDVCCITRVTNKVSSVSLSEGVLLFLLVVVSVRLHTTSNRTCIPHIKIFLPFPSFLPFSLSFISFCFF